MELKGSRKYILKSVVFPELRLVAHTHDLSIPEGKAGEAQEHREFEVSLSCNIENPLSFPPKKSIVFLNRKKS